MKPLPDDDHQAGALLKQDAETCTASNIERSIDNDTEPRPL